jgi:hypothetical protein
VTIAASSANLRQYPMAFIGPVATIGRLRRAGRAGQCAQCGERSKQKQSSGQSLDHDALPLIATDKSLLAVAERRHLIDSFL